MGGSQLSQLKAALHSSSISSNSSHRGGGSEKKKSNSNNNRKSGVDEESRKAKLESIRQSLNKFDVKTTKTKHSVVNAKPLKGSTGRPGLSKQTGIENRRKTLLPQWQDRNHAGAIVDRRFGEDDPTMTPEEKALQRFTFERQRKASRSSLFNLDNDNDDGAGSGPGELLTHYGQNLDTVRGPLADQEDLFQKSLSVTPAAARHLQDDAEAEGSGTHQRKRTRAEIMEEVMAKSKMYKYERQKTRNEDEEVRLALDDDLASIRGMLGAPNRREPVTRDVFARGEAKPALRMPEQGASTGDKKVLEMSDGITLVRHIDDSTEPGPVDRTLLANLIGDSEDDDQASRPTSISRPSPSVPVAGGPTRQARDDDILQSLPRFRAANETTENDASNVNDEADGDDAYDRYVRELAFEKRAAPSDRLKTEAEEAMEAAEALQRSEAARLRRMAGETGKGDGSDDDRVGGHTKSSARQKLSTMRRAPEGDDLDDDFQEDDEHPGLDGEFGLGGGLGDEEVDGDHTDSEKSDDGSSDRTGSESDSDDDSEASAGDLVETELLADLLHRDVELDDVEMNDTDYLRESGIPTDPSSLRKTTIKTNLPYTFPCPETHAAFLDIIGQNEDQLPTIIERIRTLYHPSLAEGNKTKLARFLGVLIDHVEHVATARQISIKNLACLSQHCYSLSQLFPLSAAAYFLAKLKTMQRSLLRGLQDGSTSTEAQTWPDAGKLAVLRLVGLVSSTSDLSHPVALAAALLIGQYLNQCRIRDISDAAAGLCLISISCQYESFSRRYVPECLAFLEESLNLLFIGNPEVAHVGGHVCTKDPVSGLSGRVSPQQSASSGTISITDMLASGGEDTQHIRETLCFTALSVVEAVYTTQTSLRSFIECFGPLSLSLVAILDALPDSALKNRVTTVQDGLMRALKLSRASRRPLALQSHKPVPIPTFIPKFEQGYVPGRKFDPDSARNEAAKLKALVKKEKKGAIRELRKDSRFLAGERAKVQAEKDREYKSKIDKITAGLAEERVEEKRFERTKEREKLRDKKKAGGGRGRK